MEEYGPFLPADKDGVPITNKNEIANKHHPAPLRILKGEVENVVYASPEAVPTNEQTSHSRFNLKNNKDQSFAHILEVGAERSETQQAPR